MSPVIYGIGGEIEKYYSCKYCHNIITKIENFISLNFKKLQPNELEEIRDKFASEGYHEGIKYEETGEKKKGIFKNLFSKKKDNLKPIITIRDYLCHLNLLQKDQVE